MASTIAQAFDEFKDNIKLTAAQSQTVIDRRGSAHKYLETSFPSSSDLPLVRTTLIGSAQRDTIIRPLDDIDVLAVFENKDEIFEKYRFDSFAFINRIRNALNDYRVEIVGTRGQAVRLFYKVLPHVDIAPVFSWSGGGYALPDGSGGWLTTDPNKHNEYIDERNKALGYRLKPLARILKRWNKVHGNRLKSFHLEIITARLFTGLSNNSRDASEIFFKQAPYNLGVLDPAGHSGDLSTYLTTNARDAVLTSLKSSADRATRANEAELDGDYEESTRLWKIIFGSDFPSYG